MQRDFPDALIRTCAAAAHFLLPSRVSGLSSESTCYGMCFSFLKLLEFFKWRRRDSDSGCQCFQWHQHHLNLRKHLLEVSEEIRDAREAVLGKLSKDND